MSSAGRTRSLHGPPSSAAAWSTKSPANFPASCASAMTRATSKRRPRTSSRQRAPVAELRLLAGAALTARMNQLAADYEKAAGLKLAIRYGTTPVLIDLALRGGAFDLGVVPEDVMKDPGARARFAPGPTTDIARVGLG